MSPELLQKAEPRLNHRESVGDVKKNDLPGPEVLERPGNKDGQVIMVRTAGGSVEAHEVRCMRFG